MLKSILKDRKVKSVTYDNIEYFDVQDIKDNHPDLKVDIKEIVYVDGIALINAKHISPVTEFDKIMKQVFPKDRK
jgi:hypothetical protein